MNDAELSNRVDRTECIRLMHDADPNATVIVVGEVWRDGELSGLYAEVLLRAFDNVANAGSGMAGSLRAGDYVMCRRTKTAQMGDRAQWEPILLCPVIPKLPEESPPQGQFRLTLKS